MTANIATAQADQAEPDPRTDNKTAPVDVPSDDDLPGRSETGEEAPDDTSRMEDGEHGAVESETSLAGDFFFGAELAQAAASAGSLVVEDSGSGGFSIMKFGGGEDGFGGLLGSTALLLVGLGGLAAAVLILSDDDDNSNDPDDETPTNNAPTISVDNLTINEDTSGTVTVTTDDADGDMVSVSAGTAANGSVVDNGGGTFAYVPNTNFNGTDSFEITADDGNGGTASATVTVTVDAVNDAPSIMTDVSEITIIENDPTGATITVTTEDVDGDTVVVSGTAGNGSVTDNGDGTFTYVPDADFDGLDTIAFLADDGKGGGAARAVDVMVDPIEEAPSQNLQFSDEVVSVSTVEDSQHTDNLAVGTIDPDGSAFVTNHTEAIQPASFELISFG